MKYATSQASLRRLAKLCGFDEKFAPRAPREVLPTWPAHLGWHKAIRTALGTWGRNSEIPNGYDRAVRNTELRFRGEILPKVQERWNPRASSELSIKKPAHSNP